MTDSTFVPGPINPDGTRDMIEIPPTLGAMMEPGEPEPFIVERLADVIQLCGDITGAVDELDGRAPMPPEERIAAWHHVEAAAEALQVVIEQMKVEALDAMRQLGLEETMTDIGPVHIHRKTPGQQWQGFKLIEALSRPLIDRESGEVVPAVPVATLQRVVAGADSPSKTYSKWLTTGLDAELVDWRRFRTFEEAKYEMKVGRKPKR